MNFDKAFLLTIYGWEGGDRLHDVPGDPGGLTKFGLSQRAHPDLDIANLTEPEAKEVYHRKYWQPSGASSLVDELRWDVFDYGVNAGVGKSVKTLQHAVNLCNRARGRPLIAEDGMFGPQTRHAANALPPTRLLRVFRALRSRHYVQLAHNGMYKFLEGWLDRVDGKPGNA